MGSGSGAGAAVLQLRRERGWGGRHGHEAAFGCNCQPAGAAPQGLGEFAGTAGLATTPEFRLERGQVVFHLTHDGEGEFLAVLTDSNGNQTAALVGGTGTRVSGRMDETKTVNITFPGLHVIEVNADGNWTIDVSQ